MLLTKVQRLVNVSRQIGWAPDMERKCCVVSGKHVH